MVELIKLVLIFPVSKLAFLKNVIVSFHLLID
jgi:hypothetical protein